MANALMVQLKALARRARSGDAAQDRLAAGPQQSRSRYAWGELPVINLGDAHGPIVNVALPDSPPLDYSRRNLLLIARTHEIVNACLRIRADRLVDPTLVVERSRDGETWEAERDHPLLALARVPGDSLDTATFWRYISICWDSVGAVYLEPIKRGGMLVGVNPLDPQFVNDVYSSTGVLDTIEWYPGYGERVIFQPDQLIVRRRPLDIDPAPLMAALRAVDQDLAFAEYIRSFFLNSAVPSGIIRVHGDASQEQADEIRARWLARLGGLGTGQNGPAVLDDMAEYQAVGSKLGDLDNDTLRKVVESRIAMPFQVPPLIIYSYLGVTTATYSNLREAWRSFWDSPVLPFLREWGDWLTRAMLPFYEDPRDIYAGMVRARFDTGTIPALQEDTGPKVAMFAKAYEQGTVSVNEYRAVLGLEGQTDPAADELAALAEPEPPPEPPAPAQLTDLPPEMQAAAAAASEAAAQPEGKASPSVLTRHVAQYIEGEYAKARRLQLSSDDVDAAIAALDAALDDGLQLTAILAPSLRRDVARAYQQAGGTKAAIPRTATFATERIIETLRKRAGKIAETTRTEIAAAMRAGLDLVTAGRERASTRAETIVVTETANAENAGMLGGMSSRGVKRVKWTVGANPCADCLELDGNEYDIDGAPDVPAHPHCGCSLSEVAA
jgi:HK97 family phage portal protein